MSKDKWEEIVDSTVFQVNGRAVNVTIRRPVKEFNIELPEDPTILELKRLLKECAEEMAFFDSLVKEAKRVLKQAQDNFDRVVRSARKRVRYELEKTKMGRSKPTKDEIDDEVYLQPDVIQAQEQVRAAEDDLESVQGALRSLERKFIALRSIRSLTEQELQILTQAEQEQILGANVMDKTERRKRVAYLKQVVGSCNSELISV